jgi:hypothetical protein
MRPVILIPRYSEPKENQIMSYSGTIPMDVNPSVRKAVGELTTLLSEYGYTPHMTASICAYVAREGTVTGAPGLDAADEADASMVFEAELEPVDYDIPAWERDRSVTIDVELAARGEHPFPFDPDSVTTGEFPPVVIEPAEADAPDASPHATFPGTSTLAERRASNGRIMATATLIGAALALPSACHRLAFPATEPAVEAARFEPSEADWEDYRHWSEELERLQDMRDFYAAHPLSEFNALRDDA